MKQTFTKAERLCSTKEIERLFAKGSSEISSVFVYPFRVLYRPGPPETAPTLPQILISVSKRSFKHAVDRNLLKRRIREAYRRNKALLFEPVGRVRPASMAFVYIAKEKISFEEIEKRMKLALSRLT